jgi:hypothetical protein
MSLVHFYLPTHVCAHVPLRKIIPAPCASNGTYPRDPRTLFVFNGIGCGDSLWFPRKVAGKCSDA